MKITRVETWTVPVVPEVPYSVAYAHFDKATLAFVRIATDGGLIGFGSAGCDVDVTGETADTVVTAINNIAGPVLQGTDPFQYHEVLRQLHTALGAQPSALAAIDMALYDILGKQMGLPLWKLLGGFRDRIETSVTIGILPELETTQSAMLWLDRGFRCLKLKGGQDVVTDIPRVMAVREVFGDDFDIRFDANQGYSVEDALTFLRGTPNLDLAFIEQPTAASQPELLGQVRKAGMLPVMADESMKDAADAFFLAKNELVDMFNVKLMKCGGITAALEIEAIARVAGLPIMVGCMDESALGIAAGLHLALGRPGIMYADLDGHIGLTGDPASGLRIENGVMFPPDGPGLGIEPRMP